MKLFSKSTFAVMLLLCIVITTGASCFKGKELAPPAAVTLLIWRSEDAEEDFTQIIADYQATYSNVSFDIKTFKPDEYEEALLTAWSKGEGPDIFSVPNWKMGKYKEFITPMPASAQLKSAQTTKSGLKEKTTVNQTTITFPVPSRLKDQFVDAVAEDVIFEDKIYGLPLSFDSLTLYYNRDLLAKAQIAVPPTTWEEFRDAVQTIVQLDDRGNILQPATALGTATNVSYSFDIVSALMMQNGTTMVENRDNVSFDEQTENRRFPSVEALDFYTKFSNPAFKTYTWNDKQLHSLEAFTQGNLAFYFGYQKDVKDIDQLAPNLNYSYSALPQIDAANPLTIANYPVEAVHINSKNPEHAWNFIFFASSKDHVKSFLDSTQRVAAERNVLASQQQDPVYQIFASSALIAKTWYHGRKPDDALSAFLEMITTANAHTTPLEDIISLAAGKVQLTFGE